MALTKVQLFSLPITDVQRAKTFYVEVLGFDLVTEMPMGPEMTWLQVRPKGAATSITLVTWFETMPAGSSKGTVLESSDLEGDIAALRARGAAIEGEIQQAPWGRYVEFDDPDGNGLILQETAGESLVKRS